MGHKKRKQKNPAEPDNKKSAKLQTEEGGNAPTEVEEAAQNITVEVLPKKNVKQEVKKEEEDTEEPKKEEGNGSQSSGKSSGRKRKKKNNANKASTEPKKKKTVDANTVITQEAANTVITQEDLDKIMGALSKDNLEAILKLALKKHGDIVSEIMEVARKDPSKRKLFIRGLGWETKPETLEYVFSAYGEVENADIVMDKNSGKNKGYGFVTFKTFAGAMAALKEPNKQIDGRNTICNLSTGATATDPQQVTSRKIYVGGLPKDVDSDRLVELFSQYGEIEEGPLGFDRNTGECKGFAFFIYKSAKSAKSAIKEPTKTLDGATLNCKPAPPRDKNGTSSKLDQGMWAYGSPLTGFIPVGNLKSPLFQRPL